MMSSADPRVTHARFPRRIVSPAATRVLLALCEVHGQEGRASVTTVAERIHKPPAAVHKQLRHLRRLGLVTWEPDIKGTLRPLYGPA